MQKGEKLYEGKAKVLFATDDPNMLIQYFKDDATAFNGIKKGTIADKGVVNSLISTRIYHILEKVGIPTHLEELLSPREQLVHKVEILPIEVVIRNRVAGSLARRLGIEEGTELARPLVEFYYKNDELDDPMVTIDHAEVFGWAKHREIEEMIEMSLRINDILIGFFANIGIDLIDYKLEYGRLAVSPSTLVLADEISPDGCRLWDMETGEKLDKDRFRRDLGGVEEAYQEVARRMGLEVPGR
ncbi:phosphoribosylaminoimidazole-succinocarboxamide synthase [Magnetococcus marinus MC-1]|uniref:Phosphoribosylaminoimidazole-succinocarboxamide synthase n=1 Tax=Magnetococcus marinus (strain ATCC BAA-1437 / JCM 17883 / MC-1) TaxID=156889 RepID=PUR7_MAGMM|nr:phosphoribosylaminoimidazolesuccinocarboxamide synthase [Magnetococcus marinus]A0L4X9.1 RecName: Full=Phosphoribosylaminoimidazole-succinocarboxamide synthase; AltName: Full=SAICAR synthetase [Magnetococcus marinus MC-1]ABK43022.1 phosphoribosylaminoimidazole-succinocarboxamide synthase [Magnetococcus marinus MC-1]